MQSRVRAKLQTHVSVPYWFLFCRNWLKSLNFRLVLNARLLVNKDGSHINKSDTVVVCLLGSYKTIPR